MRLSAGCSRLGKICKSNLFDIEKLFNIKVVNYIIMPNHIHLIIEVKEHNALTGASPVHTVSTIIGVYKSLVYNKVA